MLMLSQDLTATGIVTGIGRAQTLSEWAIQAIQAAQGIPGVQEEMLLPINVALLPG